MFSTSRTPLHAKRVFFGDPDLLVERAPAVPDLMASRNSSTRAHATHMGALGKRPLELGSLEGSSAETQRKVSRLDGDALLQVLQEMNESLGRCASLKLTKAHDELLSAIRAKAYVLQEAYKAEKKRFDSRPADQTMLLKTADVSLDGMAIYREVTLPPEMIERIMSFLTPNQLGRVACVCRGWLAAVGHEAQSRVLALQLELPPGQRVTTRWLSLTKDQDSRAPALIAAQSYDILGDFEKCVLRKHIDLFVPHLAASSDYKVWMFTFSVLNHMNHNSTASEWFERHLDLIVDAISRYESTLPVLVFTKFMAKATMQLHMSALLPALDGTPTGLKEKQALEAMVGVSSSLLAHLPGLRAKLQLLTHSAVSKVARLAQDVMYNLDCFTS